MFFDNLNKKSKIFYLNWYGKYGFRPYDNIKDKINRRMNIKYERNQNIMETITIIKFAKQIL